MRNLLAHLAILDALGVRHAVLAVTRSDLDPAEKVCPGARTQSRTKRPWPTVYGRFRVWRNAGVFTAPLDGLILARNTVGWCRGAGAAWTAGGGAACGPGLTR